MHSFEWYSLFPVVKHVVALSNMHSFNPELRHPKLAVNAVTITLQKGWRLFSPYGLHLNALPDNVYTNNNQERLR